MNAVWKKIWPENCIAEATVEMPHISKTVTLGKTNWWRQFNNDNNNKNVKEEVKVISANKFTTENFANILKFGRQLQQKALDMNPDGGSVP